MAGGRLPVIHQPEHERVQPQARERHETCARLWRAGEKQPAAAVARPGRGAPSLARLRFAREQLQRIRDHVERGEHAAALGGRLPVDDRRVRCPCTRRSSSSSRHSHEARSSAVGRKRQQVRKDPARPFREERILVAAIRKQRRRERERFGLVPQFVAGLQYGDPRIERIENHIAAFGPVELRRVFERRVVHDGGVAAVLELPQNLPDERRLAGARVRP